VVKAYNSLDEIAAAYQIPAGPFKQQVEEYNRYVAQGKDDQLGRYMHKDLKPIGAEKPIYVLRLLPKVHYTMGGIEIDTAGRVLDVTTDKPIAGLYAAGESSGGVHGAVRLGSCSSVSSLVYGRIVGKNAAAEKAWA